MSEHIDYVRMAWANENREAVRRGASYQVEREWTSDKGVELVNIWVGPNHSSTYKRSRFTLYWQRKPKEDEVIG